MESVSATTDRTDPTPPEPAVRGEFGRTESGSTNRACQEVVAVLRSRFRAVDAFEIGTSSVALPRPFGGMLP